MLCSIRCTGIFALVVFVLTGCASDTPPDGHTINEELQHPESVAYDAENDVFYATNFGPELQPTEKDGQGFISRLAADGSIDSLRYLPVAESGDTLHAPKGTVVHDGHLYTADIDRIVGFDLGDGSKSAEIAVEGTSFLNGLTVFDAQTLLVSETNQGQIYQVDLDADTARALDIEVPGVNGLVYSSSQEVLYAVTFGGEQGGQLWTIELTDEGTVSGSSSRTILEEARFDGIVHHEDDHLLISDWGIEGDSDAPPALHRVADHGNGDVTTIEVSDWQGPADFECGAQRGCWIPDLPASTVTVVRPHQR